MNVVGPLPERLSDDPIVEALFEIRFVSDDQPAEVTVGRLMSAGEWKSWSSKRLPAADIPAPIRFADANLKHTAILELGSPEIGRLVRIGANVLSIHVVGRYCGWEKFSPELESITQALFSSLNKVQVVRCGLRYLNALVPGRHGVGGVSDLALSIEAGGNSLRKAVNLNFIQDRGPEYRTTVRIATPEFIQGNFPNDISVVVDVDVATPDGICITDQGTVMKWLDEAHKIEKAVFFSLLKKETIRQLEVEGSQ